MVGKSTKRKADVISSTPDEKTSQHTPRSKRPVRTYAQSTISQWTSKLPRLSNSEFAGSPSSSASEVIVVKPAPPSSARGKVNDEEGEEENLLALQLGVGNKIDGNVGRTRRNGIQSPVVVSCLKSLDNSQLGKASRLEREKHIPAGDPLIESKKKEKSSVGRLQAIGSNSDKTTRRKVNKAPPTKDRQTPLKPHVVRELESMSAWSPVASVRSVLADESANEPDLVTESTHLEALAIEDDDDDDDDVIPGFPKGRFWLHSVEITVSTQSKMTKSGKRKPASQKSGFTKIDIASYYDVIIDEHDDPSKVPLSSLQNATSNSVIAAEESLTSRTTSLDVSAASSVGTTPEPTSSGRQLLKRSARPTKRLVEIEFSDSDVPPSEEASQSDNDFNASASSKDPDESDIELSDADEESSDSSLSEPALKRRKTSNGRGILSRAFQDSDSEGSNIATGVRLGSEDVVTDDGLGSNPKSKAKKGKSVAQYSDNYTFRVGIDKSLPPISKNADIFSDITSRALDLGFDKVVKRLGSRKLNIATMCSGTESPVLALKLISDCLKDRKISFQVNHLFSAEIVPFKQAYIERNFSPPIIFRDICELSLDDATEATTAYGATVPIPAGVDMLIAGFSCVDFSGLNNNKLTLEDGGESGDTLKGILAYADRYRPKIMILENVSGAPWIKLRDEIMPTYGYQAAFARMDTKEYYIPHTRQRGYMVCIDTHVTENATKILSDWSSLITKFKRPASSSVEAFLLDEDDPRVVTGRIELASGRGENRRIAEVDWARCHGRHQDYRAGLSLGQKRPIMNWEDGGSCKAPDYMWRDWTLGQVERVWDTIDIAWLRNLNRGYDHQFKIRILELSQNVDRVTDNIKTGITGCITPSGIPFSTLRGGPLIGLECLALQGLPIDQLQLTRESQASIKDLAGNAMTSTVVGAAVLSALIAAFGILPKEDADAVAVDVEDKRTLLCTRNRLEDFDADLASYKPQPVAAVIQAASKTIRLCLCEGRAMVTTTHLQQCRDCGHTNCVKCGVGPNHSYVPLDVAISTARLPPWTFEAFMKDALPMKIAISEMASVNAEQIIRHICTESGNGSKDLSLYSKSIKLALESELRFHSMKRSEIWTVYYESQWARLELVITKHQVEWRLFAKPDVSEPGNSSLRALLQYPIARMQPTMTDLTIGDWQLFIHAPHSFEVVVTGAGGFTRSFEDYHGLGSFADTAVFKKYTISASDEDIARLDMDIRGSYRLRQMCGAASGTLHVQEKCSNPLYLFLDPDRVGDPKDDLFVFTTDRRRLSHEEVRPRVASFHHSWRQPMFDIQESTDGEDITFAYKPRGTNEPYTKSPEWSQPVRVLTEGYWVSFPDARIVVPRCRNVLIQNDGGRGQFFRATSDFDIQLARDGLDDSKRSCGQAHIALRCRSTIPQDEASPWKKTEWLEISLNEQREFFSSFAWLMEKSTSLPELASWAEVPNCTGLCDSCSPPLPSLKWKLDDKLKLVPFEDAREASPFERALKARPSPLVTQVQIDGNGFVEVTLSINPETLVHRATANLPRPHQGMQSSWRLVTDYVTPAQISLSAFVLGTNDNDAPAAQPPGFKSGFQLRPEQLRSLAWMISQENKDVKPFVEEEIEEAVISQIGWRLEGRAAKTVTIRGGVLADHVGYGKTPTTLALIDSQRNRDRALAEIPVIGAIPLKATLILVPKQLPHQWYGEIRKFLKTSCNYEVMIIKTLKEIEKLTIEKFQAADIIIAPWDLFEGDNYLFHVAEFAGLLELPDKAGSRAQDVWYANALKSISEHIELLKNNPTSLAQSISQKYDDHVLKAGSEDCIIPSKRRRGQAYQDAKKHVAGNKRKTPSRASTIAHDFKKRVDTFGANEIMSGRRPWNKLKCALLEMFEFSRIVVDEYTYVTGKEGVIIPNLKSKYKWILSATPPLSDFADIKSISRFLGINLGITDLTAGVTNSSNIKTLSKDQTKSEEFRSFKRGQSAAWHENRHGVAQRFLDQFARSNSARIDAIPGSRHLMPVHLPAAERAIYLELVQLLAATEFTIKKRGKSSLDNDRVRRITELLGTSASAGEALMKSASHFTLDNLSAELENAPQACDTIVGIREKQYEHLKRDFRRKLKQALFLYSKCHEQCIQYTNWKKQVKSNTFGDSEATIDILALISKIEDWPIVDGNDFYYDHRKEKGNNTNLLRTMPIGEKAFNQELRNVTNDLRKLSTELVSRKRCLRFFKVVRDLQRLSTDVRNGVSTGSGCTCSRCGKSGLLPDQISVLPQCGHVFCAGCVSHRGGDCLPGDCKAESNGQLIQATELGVEDDATRKGRHYGKKIEDIVRLVQQIPDREHVLLFVQFTDLMDKISNALKDHNITAAALSDGKSASDVIDSFQAPGNNNRVKVLLLNIGDASAAGSNLTAANHVIFVSPYLVNSDQAYIAAMIQAEGRARRYGQTNPVHVYHFLTLNTIDVDTIQMRQNVVLKLLANPRVPEYVPFDGFKDAMYELGIPQQGEVGHYGSTVAAIIREELEE